MQTHRASRLPRPFADRLPIVSSVRIVAKAPVRTADIGGWTDTWFSSAGSVCSVAIEPGITVTVDAIPGKSDSVALTVGGESRRLADDPLIEAAIRNVPVACALHVQIDSGVPVGSGLGTSASVTVALLAALDALRLSLAPDGARVRSADELACDAHRVETSLGWQSGVQDQLAAAHGGVNQFEVRYPNCGSADRLDGPALRRLLDDRLLTVYLGRPHSSSAVHESVIASLEGVDNEPLLAPLRRAAADAANALRASDLRAYGQAMIDAHEGTRSLHADLVCPEAEGVVEMARHFGALGWKVNGAGGNGGSIAVLGPSEPQRMAALVRAFDAEQGVELLRTRVAALGVSVVRG